MKEVRGGDSRRALLGDLMPEDAWGGEGSRVGAEREKSVGRRFLGMGGPCWESS